MNLAQMAAFVTNKVGVYDAVSTALAKSFIDKEYKILWDKYPWTDTQMTATAVAAPTQRLVNYPAGMDRIITVRAHCLQISHAVHSSDARFLDPIDSTFLIESDPTMFERSGYVVYYEENTDPTTGDKQINLYPRPVLETSLLFIGKAICPGLTVDTDTSVIRNLDEVLMTYGYFDFLQRQRQFGKAKEVLAEAKELEANAWALEQQQANLPRRTKATTAAGNTLAEMTDSVCTICGQWTPEYRTVIKEFLRRNYQTMYDTFLWPESLVVVRVGYVSEQVIMPHYIDKVLGVRGDTNMRMFPADAGLFLDISPGIFEEVGDPIGFTTLTPVAVSTLPPLTSALTLASTASVDLGKVYIRGQIIATGQELEEEITLQGTTPVITANAYDIPITIAKDITVGDVTVNASNPATALLNLEIIPSYMRELKHQRLWFLPNPNTASLAVGDSFSCIVLAKVAIHPLVSDQDTPIITGAQQVLIAAAAADLYRKLEKPDQANAMLQKADGSMAVLKAKNTDQAASAPRFVPQVEPRAYVAGGVGGCIW